MRGSREAIWMVVAVQILLLLSASGCGWGGQEDSIDVIADPVIEVAMDYARAKGEHPEAYCVSFVRYSRNENIWRAIFRPNPDIGGSFVFSVFARLKEEGYKAIIRRHYGQMQYPGEEEFEKKSLREYPPGVEVINFVM